VWVVDRENSRIQIFNAQGEFIDQWTDLFRPTGIYMDKDGIVYISEFYPRVSIFTPDGTLIARWGGEGSNTEKDLFVAPHAVAVDSRGDIYIGEVPMSKGGHAVDRGLRTVQKFARRT
jgi:sugar lactone lactonase YvrE